ncbi:MAG TPA: ABC transporter permease [Coxiellaceae bacterium]|nr:ABC transporter permease [Coxiellaceae bacterium]
MSKDRFCWARYWAVTLKEFVQMRRDHLTFAVLIMIPLIQLILFGYAINTNPKNLPTALVMADHSAFTRAFVTGLKNSNYFHITALPKQFEEAEQLIKQDKVLFAIYIPPNFTRDLIRGTRPELLVEADATNPVAVASGVAAVQKLVDTIFNPLLKGPLLSRQGEPVAVNLITHQKYNPESLTAYSIVPGLIGVVLTMTMVVITSQAITREREIGTMENLLATPVRPLEVMLGKITPYMLVGYLQFGLILLAAHTLFQVPVTGNIAALALWTVPFLAANLSVGLTFSSLVKNQLQAVQLSFFFFLPSILLSGFMFPFSGMPVWAQWLGEGLPLTHYLRITRGILLKGNGWSESVPELWPILVFALIVLFIGLKRYRQTLD